MYGDFPAKIPYIHRLYIANPTVVVAVPRKHKMAAECGKHFPEDLMHLCNIL